MYASKHDPGHGAQIVKRLWPLALLLSCAIPQQQIVNPQDLGPRCVLSTVVMWRAYEDSTGSWFEAVLRWPSPVVAVRYAEPFPVFPEIVQCTTLVQEEDKAG